MRKFYLTFKKNQFWFWTAIETYAVAMVFIVRTNFFDLEPPARTVLGLLDDPLSVFLISVVGTFALSYSIWDFHWFFARPVMIGLLTLVWMATFLGFLIHDIEAGALISPGAVLSGGVICRVVTYAFTGDD
ncbi:hypothetical protein [Lentilactobacillus sp. Marseille-Q4993]|uniref:hypothetical protein n=1 Tax=Lentilactobacillus sp. Marseille-Q4993 TaxID=3039492 RepID=UPI0024BCA512|nr:hypothetical protein [Lentilactobacillus sp. Marseille-Q4993]